MSGAWSAAVLGRYEAVLDSARAVLAGCPDEQWEASMWEVRASDPYVWPPRRPGGLPPEDAAERARMLQAFSAVWFVAYHALFLVDHDLGGGFAPWAPPAPFRADDQDACVVPRTYSRDELLGYVEHCRRRARAILGGLRDDEAARPLPASHRYAGRRYAEMLLAALLHLQEHVAQVEQFVSSSRGRQARPGEAGEPAAPGG